MTFKKLSSLLLVPALLMSLFTSAFFVLPASAQEEAVLACPIQGSFSITSDLVGKTVTVEDSLVGTFTLENGTAYFLPEIKVGVGIYTSDNETVPSYWTVLPNSTALPAKAGAVVDVDLSLKSVPEGEYTVKLFVAQGSEIDIFGSALRDFNTAANFSINKVTPSIENVSLKTNLNSELASSNNSLNSTDTFLLEATAKNNGTSPITNAELTAVLTQGDISLAGAVTLEPTNNLKLIPNGEQTIKLTNDALTEGDYSAYVLINIENSLQAVSATKVKVGERSGTQSWPYISLLGVSDFPPTEESEVVACINYLGLGAEARQLHSTLGVEFTGVQAGTEIFNHKVSNLEGNQSMYFTHKLGALSDTPLILTATLLEDTTGDLIYAGTEPADVTVQPIDYLTPTQNISVTLTCAENLGCNDSNSETMSNNYLPAGPKEPFWFYAGVAIAALLLMYLMLRRLHPEDSHPNSKLSDSELQ